MSNKLRIKLITVLAVCVFACTFAGCSIGLQGIDEYRDYYGITASVTYYGNGGTFDSNASLVLEYTTGTYFYSVKSNTGTVDSSSSSSDSADSSSSASSDDSSSGSSSSSTTNSGSDSRYVSRRNYDLVGWYEVAQRTSGDDTLYFVVDLDDDDVAAAFTKVSNTSYSYTYSDTTVYYVKDTDFIESDGAWLITQEEYDEIADLKKYYSDVTLPDLAYSDTEVTSSLVLEDGEKLYVAAKWREAACIRYYLVLNHSVDGYDADSVTATSKSGTETVYQEYDLISKEYYEDETIQRSDSADVLTETGLTLDATLIGYFYDKECTQPVSGATFTRPSSSAADDERYTDIYACYITGEWTMLRDSTSIKDSKGNLSCALFSSGSGNYYLTGDIDFTGLTLSPSSRIFSARVEGNGYAFKNMTYSKTGLTLDSYTAIFGQLGRSAIINNLTIDTLEVNYTARSGPLYIYLLFNYAQDGTSGSKQINGLTVKNVSLDISCASSVTISNMRANAEGYESDNWLYGIVNAEEETDEQFAAIYGGATVSNYTVTINDEVAFQSSSTD